MAVIQNMMFTITSQTNGNKIQLKDITSGHPIIYIYNDQEGTASGYTAGTSITLDASESIKIYSNNSIAGFTISASGNIKASGNLLSLLAGNGPWTSYSSDPAVTMGQGAFMSLFEDCQHLVNIEELYIPKDNLSISCYEKMFKGCTNLSDKIFDSLQATTLSPGCYSSMFEGCSSLTAVPICAATSFAYGCFSAMYKDCTMLTTAMGFNSTLQSARFTSSNFGAEMKSMYEGCVSLSDVSPIGTLNHGFNPNSYNSMFKNCRSIITPLSFSTSGSDTLQTGCCESMYEGCTGLTSASAPTDVVTTTGVTGAFKNMYNGCSNTNFKTVTLSFAAGAAGESGCQGMFANCTSLETANITFNTVYTSTAEEMFYGCISLKNISLTISNAAADAKKCCQKMFMSCTGLINNSSQPQISLNLPRLTESFCQYMFLDCKKLQKISGTLYFDANNTSLSKYACYGMFAGCEVLNNISDLNLTDYIGESACQYMFAGCVSGSTNNYGIQNNGSTTKTLQLKGNYACAYMFSAPDEQLSVNCLSYRNSDGTHGTFINYTLIPCKRLNTIRYTLTIDTNAKNACEGMFKGCTALSNINNTTISNTLAEGCCKQMFMGCTSLNIAVNQSFYNSLFNSSKTTYAKNCYQEMFSGCTALVNIPVSIGSSTGTIYNFNDYCFAGMFDGCQSITASDITIQGNFGTSACMGMFRGCTSLASVKTIKTTTATAGEESFREMFKGCTSLTYSSNNTIIDLLSLTQIPNGICQGMFQGCISLDGLPFIITSNYQNSIGTNEALKVYGELCFSEMFKGCTSINRGSQTISGGGSITYDRHIWGVYFGDSCFKEMFAMPDGSDPVLRKHPFNIKSKKIGERNPTLGPNACVEMFKNCKKLHTNIAIDMDTTAGTISKTYNGVQIDIPAPGNVGIIGQNALQEMYVGCDELVYQLPENGVISEQIIRANEAYNEAFKQAFKGCKNLDRIPELLIKKYNVRTCEQMFANCPKLVNIGQSLSHATKAGDYAFYEMFMNSFNNSSLVSLWDTEGIEQRHCYLPGGYINYRAVTTNDLTDAESDYSETPKYSYTYSNNGMQATGNYFLGNPVGYGGYQGYVMDDSEQIRSADSGKLELGKWACARMFYNCKWLGNLQPAFNNVIYNNYSCYQMFGNCPQIITPINIMPTKYEKAIAPALNSDEWTCKVSGGRIQQNSQGYLAVTAKGDQIYKPTTEAMIQNIPDGAFAGMFINCTKLNKIAPFNIMTIGKNGCNAMYKNCKAIETLGDADNIRNSITSIGDYGFAHIFSNCSKLKFNNNLIVEKYPRIFSNLNTLGKYALCGMFENCGELNYPIEINNGVSINEGCFSSMYLNCVNMLGSSSNKVITLNYANRTVADYCFMNMFRNCTQITEVYVNIGTAGRSCCENMFLGCTALHTAHLNVKSLKTSNNYAFSHMFYNCSFLSNVYGNLVVAHDFDLTNDWLFGVSESGHGFTCKYYYNNKLDGSKIQRDTSSVPETWQLEGLDESEFMVAGE